MDEVVESSCSALHLMAKDPYNRLIMRQLNVIPTFVQVCVVSGHEWVVLTLLTVLCCSCSTLNTREYSVRQ